MKKLLYILAWLFAFCTHIYAQTDTPDSPPKPSNAIFNGISGGVMLHIGYLFSDSPDKIFSNTGLGSLDYIKGLPNDGACIGAGALIRIHLINHIHLGAEGHISTMPLMKTGSNVRSAWAGALCDFYTNWGKTRPLIGLSVGGGVMQRTYVPQQDPEQDQSQQTNYNASYVKTPFFYMDPYIGLEIGLGSSMAIMVKIDYMLNFGKSKSSLTENVNWNNFMTPSGPRLHVGLLLGKL